MRLLRQHDPKSVATGGIRAWLPLAALACGMTGCTVGPKYHPPAPQAPAAYKESPSNFQDMGEDASPWKVAQPRDAKLRGDWWTIFHDPELDALEAELNIDNQNIKVYFEDFMQARAIVREARSQYFPTFGTSPAWNRQRSSGNLRNSATAVSSGVVANTGEESTIYSLPFDVSWEPDLWGRIRSTVHEYQYAAQMSAADLENERLTEQATLAELFFEIRGQDALVELYRSTVQADQQAVGLTQAQYDTGVGDKISLVEAQNTLQSAEAGLTNLGVLRAQYENAIAVLVGAQPATFSIPRRAMTATPPPVPIGVPSQLLERRPDIAAAERNMAAANAEIGIAYTAYYPTLTLSAAGGTQTSLAKHLLDWPSRFWSIGPTVSETIYDGGLRLATVHQYIAVYNANLAIYRQTVLTAFGQVEQFLAAVRILSREVEQQREVVGSAQSALDLEMDRYRTGVDPYIDVVTLQTTLLIDRQALASIQVQQMTSSVQLVESLGGGWGRSQLPTPRQVTAKPTSAETKIQR